jgi:methylenetetrahydrofolate dehydrogenase (NADP+)/methenyltetrahydrofolate cyclohydrolase
MTATKLDGVLIAKQIKEDVAAEVTALAAKGIVPGLAVVLVGADPASQVYVRSKARTCEQLGIYSEKYELPAETTTEELMVLIDDLNHKDSVDGILVQSPLPKQIDTPLILEAVLPEKDVDGFHPVNVGRLVMKKDSLVPCTPAGIIEMLKRYDVSIAGKHAVVIGRSDIVGKPISLLLLHNDATVTICHSRTKDLASICRQADILVAAIGRPAMVTGDFIKPGAVVIDVGVNRVEDVDQVRSTFADSAARIAEIEKKGYTLVGDVHSDSAGEVASLLTPVPGGVGQLTIALLMKNTVKAAKMRRR